MRFHENVLSAVFAPSRLASDLSGILPDCSHGGVAFPLVLSRVLLYYSLGRLPSLSVQIHLSSFSTDHVANEQQKHRYGRSEGKDLAPASDVVLWLGSRSFRGGCFVSQEPRACLGPRPRARRRKHTRRSIRSRTPARIKLERHNRRRVYHTPVCHKK